ncbi:MAG: hypothetical protein ICV66_04590 [Chitinophagaceae bacterium]|nr:hypothetical protein [Chitinophagaceae bacterium]
MKRFNQLWIYALAMMLLLTSCEVIGDIFKAGVWVGIILVVGVIALIIWLLNRFRR